MKKGFKHSEKTREKRTGCGSSNWKGGIWKNSPKEYMKKYFESHREYYREWERKFKEKYGKDKKQMWREKNPEKNHFQHFQRHMRERKAHGNHTLGEWQTLKAQYNWTCPACKKEEPKIKLTADHIIPLSRGGSNNIENIQPLCQNCNSKKGIHNTKYLVGNTSLKQLPFVGEEGQK